MEAASVFDEAANLRGEQAERCIFAGAFL